MTAQDVIELLKLEPLPEEGGFYRETFRDSGKIVENSRNYSTCIYYLVTEEEFSALHRVKSTEIFHHYLGDPVSMLQFGEDQTAKEIIIGKDLVVGHSPQVIVPPKIWQGTKLVDGGQWALLGCTVSPGFEFEDFEVKSRGELTTLYPALKDQIAQYTR